MIFLLSPIFFSDKIKDGGHGTANITLCSARAEALAGFPSSPTRFLFSLSPASLRHKEASVEERANINKENKQLLLAKKYVSNTGYRISLIQALESVDETLYGVTIPVRFLVKRL